MKKITHYLSMILVFLITTNLLPQEEDENISFLIESSAQSKYVWRGLTYNSGLIIQPAITASYANFNTQVWGSYTVNDVDDEIKRHELDFILWYDYEIEGFTFSPSFNYYKYPGQDDSPPTAELGLSASFSLDELTFGTSFTKDVIETKGAFAGLLEIGYEPLISDNLTVNITSGLGWANKSFNEYYVGISKNSLSYFSLNGTINYSINEVFTISPFIESYFILDADFKELLYNSVFNYGISFSFGL